MKKTFCKIAVILMATVMIFSCAFTVSAAGTGKITVKVGESGGAKIEDTISVSMYKIANSTETGFVITEDFSASGLDCTDTGTSNLRAFANYAKNNSVSAQTFSTDSDNEIVIEDLDDGIYLFVVDESGSFAYQSTAPFAVTIQSGAQQTYNLTLTATNPSQKETEKGDETTVDSTSETAKESESTTETEISSESAKSSDTAAESDTSLAKALAQTGMLQWPIPVFGGLGLVLIVIGIIALVANKKKAKSR